ncbi:hypothetical protein Efla_001503 [Eimeria flavescens]
MLLSLPERRQVETPQERYHKPTTLQQQARETEVPRLQHHDHPTAGHMGVTKTYDSFAKIYLWPGISSYVQTYMQSCPRDRQAKHVSAKPQGLLQSLRIHNRRWATASLDFIMGLPKTARGNNPILTIVDSLSKMAHVGPPQTAVTAEGVVEPFADRLVRFHGLPENSISDRDTRRVADLWGKLCKQFQINRAQINRALPSACHPRQTSAARAPAPTTLEHVLRSCIQSDEAAWEDFSPAVELAYNCSTHKSTRRSPFEVTIGENPLRASDLGIVDAYEPTLTPPMTKLFQRLVEHAAADIIHAQAQQQFYANQH